MVVINFQSILFFLALILLTACHQNENGPENFCELLKKDQSYVNNDKSDLAQFEKDKAQRVSILKNNFDWLIEITRKEGFPNKNNHPNDSCVSRAVEITLVHAAQINQKKLFQKSIISLFKKEIKKGNLDKEILKRAITIMILTSDICKKYEEEIIYAVDQWELKNDLFQGEALSSFFQKMKIVEC